MKRDLDLIRKILLHVEEHDNLDFAIDAYDEKAIGYHVRLLNQAGLLHAVAQTTLDGNIILQNSGHTALSWEGHEFLDAARDEGRWKEARAIVKDKAGTVTVSVLSALLVQLMRQAIGL